MMKKEKIIEKLKKTTKLSEKRMYVVKLKDDHYDLIFKIAEISTEVIRAASFRTCGKKKTSYQKQLEDISSLTQFLLVEANYIEDKEPKKWRPFKDHNEFKAWVGKNVGETIRTREISSKYETEDLITGLNDKTICLASTYYNYDELFSQYEWLNPRKEWQFFGVLKDE